jgi:hypothetical protein
LVAVVGNNPWMGAGTCECRIEVKRIGIKLGELRILSLKRIREE